MKFLIWILTISLSLPVLGQDTVFSLKMKLTGHSQSLETVEYSPDSKWVASGGYDGELRIYKADTPGIGNLHKKLTGHIACITTIAFSIDGTQIATGSKDNSIRIYNTASGDLIYSSTEHTGSVTKVMFDATGEFLLSSSIDGTINLYDIKNPTKKATSVKYGTPINSFFVAPNGKSIYVASTKSVVEQINFKGVATASFSGHSGKVNCMELSPDKKLIATGSDDKSIKIWDLATGAVVKTLAGHTWKVTSLSFSTDGRYLVSTCNDGNSIVWEIESGTQLTVLNAMGTNARACAFSPNSTRIAIATIMETSNHGAVIYNTPLKKQEVVALPKTKTAATTSKTK